MLEEISGRNPQEVKILQVCEKLIKEKEEEAVHEVEEALKNKPVSNQFYLLCLQIYLNQRNSMSLVHSLIP